MQKKEFIASLNRFTLSFNDDSTEDEYRSAIVSLNSMKDKVIKMVIMCYMILVLFILVYFTVQLYISGYTERGHVLLVTMMWCVIVGVVEVVLAIYPKTSKFRGILGSITPFMCYEIFLTAVNPGVDYPPGDFATVVIIWVFSKTYCSSWLIGAGCYIFIYIFFFLYSYIVDNARYCKTLVCWLINRVTIKL